MNPVIKESLADNAYRTLGINAAATQLEMETAARRMRIWPSAHRVPPTPWDFPQLGAVRRTRSDIDRALSLLRDPQSRLEHRLLWFAVKVPPPGGLETSADPVHIHSQALAGLQLAWINVDLFSLDRWADVLGSIVHAFASPELVAWNWQVECAGGFDKPAHHAEIESALVLVQNAIASGVAGRADIALQSDQLDIFAAIAAAIRRIPQSKNLALADLLDRFENCYHDRCDQILSYLRENLRTSRRSRIRSLYSEYLFNIVDTRFGELAPDELTPINFVHAGEAAKQYQQRIALMAAFAKDICGDDTLRLNRVRIRCGELLVQLALAWRSSDRYVLAQETLREAQDIAAGTSIEPGILRDLRRIRSPATKERKLNSTQSRITSLVKRQVKPRRPKAPWERQARRWSAIIATFAAGAFCLAAVCRTIELMLDSSPAQPRPEWFSPPDPPRETTPNLLPLVRPISVEPATAPLGSEP